MSETVAVLDYGMGNLHSVAKALEKVADDRRVVVTSDPAQVAKADRVIFPGVGAIRDCMRELTARGLDQAVRDTVAKGRPLLGICVGMQALMARSEENNGTECLGVFPADVVMFEERVSALGERLKVPHMGWNQVEQVAYPLWENIPGDARFYFVHSYHVSPTLPQQQVAGVCDYGVRFPAAVVRGNVFAVQFHPEKSAIHGLALLRNFLHWQP